MFHPCIIQFHHHLQHSHHYIARTHRGPPHQIQPCSQTLGIRPALLQLCVSLLNRQFLLLGLILQLPQPVAQSPPVHSLWANNQVQTKTHTHSLFITKIDILKYYNKNQMGPFIPKNHRKSKFCCFSHVESIL